MHQILAEKYHRPQFYFISSLYTQAKRMHCNECVAGMEEIENTSRNSITVFSNPEDGSNRFIRNVGTCDRVSRIR